MSTHISRISVTQYGPSERQIEDGLARVLLKFGLQPKLNLDTASSPVPAHERYLSDQLDYLRDGARTTDPATNLRLFHSFLASLPKGASGTICFRAKANIGLQHLAAGDGPEAVRWLIEAYEEAPDDPRAITNRTLAYWIAGDAQAAYRFGREQLSKDPTNEALASYLPQFALRFPIVDDGLDGIPEALRNTEPVMVGQTIFLRGRDRTPEWWNLARSAAERFPGSDALKVLVAFSYVDEITRDHEAQRTQKYQEGQREKLTQAAAVLDAHWQSKPWLLKSVFDDTAHTLAGAMIAHQLLHDRDAALARAQRVLDDALTPPDILLNAVLVALSHDQMAMARKLIDLAPDNGDLAFHAGVLAVEDGDWLEASRQFARANVPESERRVVETAMALAVIKEKGRPADGSAADAEPLNALVAATRDSPRGLILIARVAGDLGLNELSETAFEVAVEAVPEHCHIATRLMVFAYAERARSPSTMIRLLDGHLPVDGFGREHERLAIAHANEHPHRQRNVAYFERLPLALRQRYGIARAHASVLADVGRLPEALVLLRRLHGEDPKDGLVTFRLVETLRRSNDAAAASVVLRRFDLAESKGSPELHMALAQLVMAEGSPERAYPVAYDLVRRHANDAQVVLGYAGLGLFVTTPNPMFAMSVAGPGACVTMESPEGVRQSYVIDEGGEFFGVSVLPPNSSMAARLLGKRRGEALTLPKMGAEPETWAIVEVASKYLHLHRRILDGFETRFPDRPGLARFTVGEDNVDAVYDMVRRSAERNAANARTYLEQPLPLGVVSRGLGGEVVSFAQFIRSLGGQVVTCLGSGQERDDGIELAKRLRGKGAVLDPYTAWVACETSMLPELKTWFGALRTPASTTAMIKRMIGREDEGRGQRQLTLSWHEGRFYRDEVTDEDRDRRIEHLTTVLENILAHCEVVSVVVPDETSEQADLALGVGGSRFLDAAFLAKDTGSILVSDDLRYRQWAKEAVGGEGVWLQAILLAAASEGALSPRCYAKAVVGLAAHGHGHIALSGLVLYLIVRHDEKNLVGLRTVLPYLAGPTAEMNSHRAVFQHFLSCLWLGDGVLPALTVQAATGLGLEGFLANRDRDWTQLLDEIVRNNMTRVFLADYLRSWRRGHFLTNKAAAEAIALTVPPPYKHLRRRRRRRAR